MTASARQKWEDFFDYHDDNPHVLEILAEIGREAVRRGHKRLSISMLFEVARYEYEFETTGDAFKLSNSYQPYYSRLLMEEYPEFDGMFKIAFMSGDDD